jgi:transposase InsO family protein
MLATVLLDCFSRRVFSWRVSITMEAAFCVETLEDALARHGKPVDRLHLDFLFAGSPPLHPENRWST